MNLLLSSVFMNIQRKPTWLKIKLASSGEYSKVKQIVEKHQLHTICKSGDCPNMGDCWGRGIATFIILGNICTRACKFCNVTTGKPLPIDWNEAERVAESINLMGLKHAVITSVDRDDLNDFGASFWAHTIKMIKQKNPEVTLEVLVPDFQGNLSFLDKVIGAKPEIISHNLETVRKLTTFVRTKAQYDTSLQVIGHISKSNVTSKSGIMLGLGETEVEILETMDDLINVGCQVLTIGQYLQPTKNNYPVHEYIHPDKFKEYKEIGLNKGFKIVESAPLVRSSYHAELHIK
jgi:lipoyl synthase